MVGIAEIEGWGREGRGRWNEPWTVALARVVVWQTGPLLPHTDKTIPSKPSSDGQ